MYSGTTLNKKSGRIMGVHQKIDRIARRHIKKHLPSKVFFPDAKDILHFEGKNGPDGLKRKSPGTDEPWHFIDPLDTEKGALLEDILDHFQNLSTALASKNSERAAFEAAWLAHAITDGLTPAHHIPYEAALAEIREGEHHMTRDSKYKKAVMPGATRRDVLRNNWKYWGAKGLMNMHLQFELGVASTITAIRFDTDSFGEKWLAVDSEEKMIEQFLASLQKISDLDMYGEFALKGWNRRLARQTRDILVPEIARMVMCAWRVAALEANR
ncbi:hypothetical protein H6796_02020 [Candidatus Nomurabacteria bacterium]|nr:hypothetical protein [Candidatus Nomurabacteria bacterium]